MNKNYALPTEADVNQKGTLKRAWKNLWPLMEGQRINLAIATFAIVVSSVATLLAPFVIAKAVDAYIGHGNFAGLTNSAIMLFGLYVVTLIASYFQTNRMGTLGRGVLFKLRNELFMKIQNLPIAFFNQNKTGDLISRINSDTDKLNQFFAQALVQFIGSVFLMAGAAIFLIVLNAKLGIATLIPAVLVFLITQLLSSWVKARSRAGLQSLGSMSAEIQESLDNFKVIVAFNRLDYFREKFKKANDQNYNASVSAGVASNLFTPIYGLASNLGLLVVLALGLYFITTGHLTIGLLIGYVLYANSFYAPLRQLATVWSSLQLALASLDRIQDVLGLESDMPIIEDSGPITPEAPLVEFKNVSFMYPNGKTVLRDLNLSLERGKTYALVGPTGGGKTTTASLMARLYDPTGGIIALEGRDIRAYDPALRAQKIGFILQEPFLFSGTVRDNIVYGNPEFAEKSEDELLQALDDAHLMRLVSRFEDGLETKVSANSDRLSLGQKQLIAFMRAMLRKPDLLILDEATANIDTVTEQLLEEILAQLPKSTTKVIIAHRLNTIQDADEIFFVNSGTITPAGSMEKAVELLMHGKRET
jgi:ATP-binding cassette subfamily B protein